MFQLNDIVVFRDIEPYGHVAICLGPADLNGYKCIEQNWSSTRELEEVWHDYLYGNPVFLRTKNQSKKIEKTEKYKIGEKVRFSNCYISSTSPSNESISANDMQRNTGVITKIVSGANNPYLLDDGLCWVNYNNIVEVLNDKITVEDKVVIGKDNVVTCAININNIAKV